MRSIPSRLGLLAVVAILLILPGCVDTRSPSKEIVDEPGMPGWSVEFEGRFVEALSRYGRPLFHEGFPVLGAAGEWVRVWEKGGDRIAVGLFYTSEEVANRLAGARVLRRVMEIRHWTWTWEYEDVPGAVTLERPGDEGVDKWVYGANHAFVFGIGWQGDVTHDEIGRVFEAQMAVLPPFDPFDSIRPGVTASYLLAMVLAFGFGLKRHRERRTELDPRVEVFP
ncbi:MAG TPA: hypothetical protein VK960_00175 [Acidimicrobiia bacterium]|nr:hypothetical protein [Acidimicrobiia bacterium]